MLEHFLELAQDFDGEAALPHSFPQGRRPARIAGFAALPHEGLPPAVADNVGVKQIGADEEGVMGFEDIAPARFRIRLEDRPRQQHAHRLAADETGADQPSLDGKEIGQREMPARQRQHPLVAPDQQAAELLHHRLPPRRIRRGSFQLRGADEQALP